MSVIFRSSGICPVSIIWKLVAYCRYLLRLAGNAAIQEGRLFSLLGNLLAVEKGDFAPASKPLIT